MNKKKTPSFQLDKQHVQNQSWQYTVPGLIAKPTIDILLEIPPRRGHPSLTAARSPQDIFATRSLNNPAPHLMFMKGYTLKVSRPSRSSSREIPWGLERTLFPGLPAFPPGNGKIIRQLKQNLQLRYEHDRDAYTEAKTDFIQEATRLARKEMGNKYTTRSTTL